MIKAILQHIVQQNTYTQNKTMGILINLKTSIL